MVDWITLIAGILFAGLGGELFVRGAAGLARWLRIAPGVVGATIAAFSTSSPELSVAVSSAVAGTPQIALGDGLGSNIVNVALILGLALAVSSIQSSRDAMRRDFPVALLVPVITGVLLIDGMLSRLDGLLMLALFLTWLVYSVLQARKQRSASAEASTGRRQWVSALWSASGLAFLVGAGMLIVSGAKGIAASLGIDPFIIGTTVVAVGTSAPELATTLLAKIRGHDEIGLGTILGSNIFNGLFIIGVAVSIRPVRVTLAELAMALAFGLASLLLALPTRSGLIPRRRGVFLLALYAAYVATLLIARPG
jgi:cation:H+ antiporter